MRTLFGSAAAEDESEWLSISDLMAGLMVIFLFIAVVFIRPLAEENRQLAALQETLEDQVFTLEDQAGTLARQAALLERQAAQSARQNARLEAQAEEAARQNNLLEVQARALALQNARMSEIAVTWQEREQQIYQALLREFRDDLSRWNAEIEKETLLVRFNAPEVLFGAGDATIRPEFAAILADFFPRYVSVLTPFRDVLDELRIEGHTSSEWTGATVQQAYIENMRLSQDRTRAVLDYALGLAAVAGDRSWLQLLLTANGLSSSRLVMSAARQEDPDRSRRVEFRVRTTARTQIVRILEAVK